MTWQHVQFPKYTEDIKLLLCLECSLEIFVLQIVHSRMLSSFQAAQPFTTSNSYRPQLELLLKENQPAEVRSPPCFWIESRASI
jgi:hypothetical protein